MSRRYQQAFAIVRIDFYKDRTDNNLANCITIKKIVWNIEDAKSEVDRLNYSNQGDSYYFWQTTRIEIKEKIRCMSKFEIVSSFFDPHIRYNLSK